MKYFVRVGGREVEVEVDGDRVVVEGRERRAHLVPVPGTPLRHLQTDDRALTLAISSSEPGVWGLELHGTRVEAEVIDERTRHIRSLTATRSSGGMPQLKAPMPGLVVRVLVEPGQLVTTGEGLVVLEAMKMENELRATGAAVVARVGVAPGQAVEKGQVLVEFTPPPLT
jgi:biotin carboxyl carrier protein